MASMGGWSRWISVLLASGLSACILNPQPEDPLARAGASGGGKTGVGGAAAGGTTAAGGTISGYGGVPTGGGWPAAEACVARGESELLDDANDCDATLADAEGRGGTWFAYGAGASGTQSPAPEAPVVMEPDGAGGCWLHVTGSGFVSAPGGDEAFAGVGIALRTLPGELCAANGYDAQAYAGLAFRARGTGVLRVIIELQSTAVPVGAPIGFTSEVTLANEWAPFVVPWSSLVAPANVVEPFVASQIRTIRFEPGDLAAYEFWLDDVEFTSP